MTRHTRVMDISIQAILVAFLLNIVQAHLQDRGPQTFQTQKPQDAHGYKDVILYLTETQIKNFEEGHGLPDLALAAPSYNYEQQKPKQEVPINEEEGRVIQSTLDVLEGNKIHFRLTQQNDADLETSKAQETQEYSSDDIRPIEEPTTEQPPSQYEFSAQQQDKNNLKEESRKNEEQIAKSYEYLHFFTNKKTEGQENIQIFHPEPHTVKLDKEIRLKKEKNIEIQQDPLSQKKFRLIPYQYLEDESQDTRQQDGERVTKQQNEDQVRFFKLEPSQLQAIKERENQQERVTKQQNQDQVRFFKLEPSQLQAIKERENQQERVTKQQNQDAVRFFKLEPSQLQAIKERENQQERVTKQQNHHQVRFFEIEPSQLQAIKERENQQERVIKQQNQDQVRFFKLEPSQLQAIKERENQQERVTKQQNQDQVRFFKLEPSQLQAIKERENQQTDTKAQQQNASHVLSNNTNNEFAKIIKSNQLEREAARIHADAINRSPAVVTSIEQKDVSIIRRRRPVEETKHVHFAYPAPYFVPIISPQPNALPLQIVRHVPVPIVKTEAAEVAKPAPYDFEKHEIREKKVYLPVDNSYTVERVVPVEEKKQTPVEMPVYRPDKFTIAHVWKH